MALINMDEGEAIVIEREMERLIGIGARALYVQERADRTIARARLEGSTPQEFRPPENRRAIIEIGGDNPGRPPGGKLELSTDRRYGRGSQKLTHIRH